MLLALSPFCPASPLVVHARSSHAAQTTRRRDGSKISRTSGARMAGAVPLLSGGGEACPPSRNGNGLFA